MEENKSQNFLWGLLGFFVPIVGFVLFIVWNKEKPGAGKAVGIGALIRVILAIIFGVTLFILFLYLAFTADYRDLNSEEYLDDEYGTIERYDEFQDMRDIKLIVNNEVLYVTLEDNSSARALVEKLKEGNINISASDYSNFEKVGDLGFSLPRNDKNITTTPGDLILYQGDKICLYYDTNTYSFTKLGHINDITKNELKRILGSGDVSYTLSLGIDDLSGI